MLSIVISFMLFPKELNWKYIAGFLAVVVSTVYTFYLKQQKNAAKAKAARSACILSKLCNTYGSCFSSVHSLPTRSARSRRDATPDAIAFDARHLVIVFRLRWRARHEASRRALFSKKTRFGEVLATNNLVQLQVLRAKMNTVP